MTLQHHIYTDNAAKIFAPSIDPSNLSHTY